MPPLTLPVAFTSPPVLILPPSMLPVATIKPPVPKLPTLALDVTLNTPPVVKLPADKLPDAVTTLLVLSNVNAVLVLAVPASLNTTPVLDPGIVILPEMLPTTLPIKFGAVTLPLTPKVPVTFAPTPVTTNTFALPALDNVMSEFASTVTLLLPFVRADELIEINDRLPVPSVDRT